MKAYELLDSPEKWCKGFYATDSEGQPVDPKSLEAKCWCLLGAIRRCYPCPENGCRDRVRLYDRLYPIIHCTNVSNWQDHPSRTFDEVRNALIQADI